MNIRVIIQISIEMDPNTNIISSKSLFSNDELDLLKELSDYSSNEETIVEFKNGQYGYYVGNQLDSKLDEIGMKNNDWKMCPICHEKLQDLYVATSECPKCGAEVNKLAEDHEIKKNGGGGYGGGGYSGGTRNYVSCDSKINIKRKLVNELKHKTYGNHVIPADIIEIAVDKFLTISEKKIHRGSVQRGLKGMLIKYTLDAHGMSKSTKIIGKIYGLSDKQLSAADAILREYDAQGVISIEYLNIDKTPIFVSKYINEFKIDKKYMGFIIEIISDADDIGIHLTNNYKPSTKAAGAFSLFVESYPELNISKSEIIKESTLTTSTVNHYYKKLVENIDKFAETYAKWSVPPPVKKTTKGKKKALSPTFPINFKLDLI